jgi:hypothetical protein
VRSTAPAIAAAALWGTLASCGGGTLGGSGTGASGMVGPTNPGGAPGAPGVAGRGSVGGAGGSSATGGVSGWEFGAGGTFIQPCFPPPPPVCGGLCGNGRIDACTGTSGPGCSASTWSEQCDGEGFNGDSCLARGYGSGKLVCNSDCTLGEATCSPCAPPDSLVASCGPGPAVPLQAGYYSLAATDSEVALAVLQYGVGGKQTLLFQRMSPDLSVLGTTILEDFAPPSRGEAESAIWGTAMAPLPSGGWVVAFCAEPDIFLQTLDAAGRSRGRVVVAPAMLHYVCNAQVPVLAARPSGAPLMLWVDDGVVMSVVAADGLSASPPRTIVAEEDLAAGNVTAAWVGNEFAVAVPVVIDSGLYLVNGLRLLRVAPDGTTTVVGDFLAGEIEGFAAMAGGPDARDVRIVYTGIPTGGDFNTDYGMIWWRHDPAATRSTSIGGVPGDVSRPAAAVAFGDDTVVFATRFYGQGYGIVRVASDGRVVAPDRPIFTTPSYSHTATMVRRGPEIVVGVAHADKVYLARLTP